MDSNQKLIEEFYYKIWNSGDETTARRILAPDLRFRGSTGPTKSGVEEFLDYVRLIRDALSEYDCVIETIVTENQQSFAKMLFRGRHTGEFFGIAPSGAQPGPRFLPGDPGFIRSKLACQAHLMFAEGDFERCAVEEDADPVANLNRCEVWSARA